MEQVEYEQGDGGPETVKESEKYQASESTLDHQPTTRGRGTRANRGSTEATGRRRRGGLTGGRGTRGKGGLTRTRGAKSSRGSKTAARLEQPRDLMREIVEMVDISIQHQWRFFLNRIYETFERNQDNLSDFLRDRWNTYGIYPDDLARWLQDVGFQGYANLNGTQPCRNLSNDSQNDINFEEGFDVPAQGLEQVLHGIFPLEGLQHHLPPDPLNFAESVLGNQNDDEDLDNEEYYKDVVTPPAHLQTDAFLRPVDNVECLNERSTKDKRVLPDDPALTVQPAHQIFQLERDEQVKEEEQILGNLTASNWKFEEGDDGNRLNKRKKECTCSSSSSSELDESDKPIIKMVSKASKKKMMSKASKSSTPAKFLSDEEEKTPPRISCSKTCEDFQSKYVNEDNPNNGDDDDDDDNDDDKPLVVIEKRRRKIKGKTIHVIRRVGTSGSIGTSREFIRDKSSAMKRRIRRTDSSGKKAVTTNSPVLTSPEMTSSRAPTSSNTPTQYLEGTIKCTVEGCPKTFTKICSRDRHLREIHEIRIDQKESKGAKIRLYTCDELGCGKGFKRSSDLKTHKDSVHAPEAAFGCKYCNKWFKSKKYLNDHMNRYCKKSSSREIIDQTGSDFSASE